MSAQQSTADQSTPTNAATTLRFWLILFAVSAVISIISAFAGHQSILSNAGMIVSVAMIVLKVSKD